MKPGAGTTWESHIDLQVVEFAVNVQLGGRFRTGFIEPNVWLDIFLDVFSFRSASDVDDKRINNSDGLQLCRLPRSM